MADRNSVIEKIKALLSKTTAAGCTAEEELSALAMARTWIDTHDISEHELQLSREEKAILYDESEADTHDPYKIKWLLSHGVGLYCNVQIYRTSFKAGLTFAGFKSDIDFATWLLDHLSDFVHASLFEFLLDQAPDQKERRFLTRSYVAGITERITDRLIEMCERSKTERTTNSKALAVIQDQAIKDLLKAEHISIRCSAGSRAPISDGARSAGQSDGDRASFGKPVSGASATLRLGKN